MTNKQYKIGDWTFYQNEYARNPTLAVGRAMSFAASNASFYKRDQIEELVKAIEGLRGNNDRMGTKDTLAVRKWCYARNVDGTDPKYAISISEKSGRTFLNIYQ